VPDVSNYGLLHLNVLNTVSYSFSKLIYGYDFVFVNILLNTLMSTKLKDF
jgi:hypothetical protein